MKHFRLILVLGLVFSLFSCQKDAGESLVRSTSHTVGFRLGEAVTKTSLNSDGLSTSWTLGDKIAVWAKDASDVLALNAQVFSNIRTINDKNVKESIFTSALSSAMPSGDYTYYAAYPVPESTDGTNVVFTIPSTQDGKVSGGADILLATPVSAPALEEAATIADFTSLGMKMTHLLHQFRFYVPDGEDKLGGEQIERIVLTFSRPVAGKVTADYASPDADATLSDGVSTLTLKLSEGLLPSTSDEKKYAAVSLFPFTASEGETFSIKAYSTSKICTADPVDLQVRTFEKGHSTPVKLLFTEVRDFPRIRFTVSANNLGENANTITLTAPSGCSWGTTGSNVYTYNPGYEITSGETFTIDFEDESLYRAFSGQSITVTFDSEHVTATQTVTMPDMTSGYSASISASIPYLLYEDFSTVGDISSHDAYSSGINAGAKDAVSFLNGWSGARLGAEAGHSIRIACRRETSSDYDARVDSAPIIALKKSANITVSYDYGANNKYSTLITSGNTGQNILVGYVTSTTAYASNKTDGTFTDDNKFYIKEYTGTYTNLPNHNEHTIYSVPTGTVRISWRAEVEHLAGTNNCTCWFYIDNVKVQIAK